MEVLVDGRVRNQTLERLALLPVGLELEDANGAELDQPFWTRKRQRTKQHRIRDAEHGRRRADAQRHDQQRRDRQRRRPDERSRRVPYVSHDWSYSTTFVTK